MPVYPENVSRLAFDPKHAGALERANTRGADANFACGAFVSFELEIDTGTKLIRAARFQSNGCGFMVAVAESLAQSVQRTSLTEMHGIESVVDSFHELDFPPDRMPCREVARSALRNALETFRQCQIDEIGGEAILICTCFGVTEEAIERCGATTVESVGRLTNAGTGCGSCRMLIDEIVGS